MKSLKKIELGSKACFGIKERVKEVLVNSSRMSFRSRRRGRSAFCVDLPALESVVLERNACSDFLNCTIEGGRGESA